MTNKNNSVLSGNLVSIDISSSPKKADELDALEQLGKLPDTWYLQGLFTADFCAWVSTQIQQDIIPDLYSAYLVKTGQWVERGDEVRKLEGDLRYAAGKRDEINELLKAERDHSTGLQRLLNAERSDNADVVSALRKDSGDAHRAAQELRGTVNAQAEEIIRLKAALYDLMTGGAPESI